MRVEHEYDRGGALTYLAAYDVRRAVLHGHCAPSSGIAPFMDLVEQVMSQEPYKSAKRVFWIVDNGSSHRGTKAANRLSQRFPNTVMVHTPVHVSWLNQIEIVFSVVQRKVVPQRLHRPQRRRAAPRRVRRPLQRHRPALQVEVHHHRPERPTRPHLPTRERRTAHVTTPDELPARTT